MAEFQIRSDSVNVEQIMEQIRARIREKRGVDYTEQQIRELADVKLEKFLDPRSVRSDLLEQFRQLQTTVLPPLPEPLIETQLVFESHRPIVRWIRKVLRPILKLFFNPNPLIEALHVQAQLNKTSIERERKRRATDQLFYELVHNLVVELTRTGIEVKNLKMRVESLTGRLEFNERRARALEGMVVYKPEGRGDEHERRAGSDRGAEQRREPREADIRRGQGPQVQQAQQPPQPQQGPQIQQQGQPEGPGQRSRRRRRRRGRRGGAPAQQVMGTPPGSAAATGDGPSHITHPAPDAPFEHQPGADTAASGSEDAPSDDPSSDQQ